MMLHTIHTMTLRRYSQMEQTGKISLLKRWYNPLPVGWFDVQGITHRIATSLNSDADRKIITEAGKVAAYNKVLKLQALHMAIYNLLILKPENDSWGIAKKKTKTENLSFYLSEVEKETGIIIKTLKDLEKLSKTIQQKKDKYLERYKESIDKGEAIPFIQFAFSVFSIMEMDYEPDMTLAEFSNLVQVADKKLKQFEKLKLKNGRH